MRATLALNGLITPKENSIVILGDSIVKYVSGGDLAKKMKSNCKFYVKHFPGAKIDCMIDYSKLSVQEGPDHFIWHIGVNDLKSEKRPECIAESIIDLDVFLKNEKLEVSFSNIIVRTGNQHLNQKGTEVNKRLLEFCKDVGLPLIDTPKRIKLHHLNKSKLHLNKNRFRNLSDIYYKETSKIFN